MARHAQITSPPRLLLDRLRRKARDERGAAAIEMALITPFLVILFLGSVEAFLMSMAARKAARVTNTVGDLVTQAKGTLHKSDINGYYKAARFIMGSFPVSRLGLSVYTFGKGKTPGSVKLKWKHQLGAFACHGTPSLNSAQRASMQDGNDLVLVYGCYRYQVRIARLIFGNLTLNLQSQIALRPRQGQDLPCKDCSS